MIHNIKIATRFYEAAASGAKPFELRRNDRAYRVGDTVVLQEWAPGTEYTGRETKKEITYILHGGQYGLKTGWCILGLAPITAAQ